MIFFKGFILSYVMVILRISVCELQSGLSSAIFKKLPIQGTYLEVYDTRNGVRSETGCGDVCSKERADSTKCEAFYYHPLDRTCDLYTTGGYRVGVSNINVFEFQGHVKGTLYYTNSTGDRPLFSIFLSKKPMSYSAARTQCHDLGGHLLQLNSLDKYEAIKMLRDTQCADSWVGANDLDTEGTWVSEKDGLPIDPSTWLWSPDEPNNYGNSEDCGSLDHNSMTMNDVPCNYPIPCHLCEKIT